MRASTPHFLLFSDSQLPTGSQTDPCEGGRWRFVLESLDGSTQFAAADDEREVARERLDLLAVVRGLEALDQPSRVTLLTPSRYISRGIRFGLDYWRENDWRWESFGEMAPVPNADLWRRLDRAMGIHQVRCRAWRFESPQADQGSGLQGDGVPQNSTVPLAAAVVPRRAGSTSWRRSGPLAMRRKLSEWIRALIVAWRRRMWLTAHGGPFLANCS